MPDEFDPSEVDAAPVTSSAIMTSSVTADDPCPILIRWELRRIGYNAILAMEMLVFTGFLEVSLFLRPSYWGMLAVGAVGANLCDCAGPVSEAYLDWLGIRGWVVGFSLLMLGTFASMGAAVFAL